MSYLGNKPATGENNSFKILDDISSYTLTFDGSSASVVSIGSDTITQLNHRFITGQRVLYTTTGSAIGGLTSGFAYYVIKVDQNTIKLALTLLNANNNNAINITSVGTGSTHNLKVAFDGINTKFKATYDNGTKALMTRAAQLTLSVNGVIQQPQDTTTPTNGFGIDLDSIIVFSTPPVSTDIFWGHLVANNFASFDISDNTVDSFTGDGSTISFTLSKEPANNQNLLVTLDGVVQYPSDNYTIRAYSVSSNVLTFVGAPGSGVQIQVRHIGFAGATSSNVTGFYGRTGNVGLTTGDNVSIGNINSVGIITATGGFNIGIQSASSDIATGVVTALNFIGIGNTIIYNPSTKTVDISIQSGVGGTWSSYTAGIATAKSVGINTTNLDDLDLTGIGNSFQGIYVSNGMMIMDNTLTGNHYIGTNFNGLMAGPVDVQGSLTVDGIWVVV
jgi:hypothetical protein